MAEEDTALTRAEQLTGLDELTCAMGELIDGMQRAGAGHASVTSLLAAHAALGGGAVGYNPGSRTDRQPGAGYGSDSEFLDALHDVTGQVREREREVARLAGWFEAAAGNLGEERDDAARDLQAAYTMPVSNPCTGCHGARETEIARAGQALAEVERRIRVVQDALDLLGEPAMQLDQALAQLRQVPHDLGEAYELVYAFVAAGGTMPAYGRWVEGGRR
jgi:hypothetical protein